MLHLHQVDYKNSTPIAIFQNLQRPTVFLDNLFHYWQAKTSPFLLSAKERGKHLLSVRAGYAATVVRDIKNQVSRRRSGKDYRHLPSRDASITLITRLTMTCSNHKGSKLIPITPGSARHFMAALCLLVTSFILLRDSCKMVPTSLLNSIQSQRFGKVEHDPDHTLHFFFFYPDHSRKTPASAE